LKSVLICSFFFLCNLFKKSEIPRKKIIPFFLLRYQRYDPLYFQGDMRTTKLAKKKNKQTKKKGSGSAVAAVTHLCIATLAKHSI